MFIISSHFFGILTNRRFIGIFLPFYDRKIVVIIRISSFMKFRCIFGIGIVNRASVSKAFGCKALQSKTIL